MKNQRLGWKDRPKKTHLDQLLIEVSFMRNSRLRQITEQTEPPARELVEEIAQERGEAAVIGTIVRMLRLVLMRLTTFIRVM